MSRVAAKTLRRTSPSTTHPSLSPKECHICPIVPHPQSSDILHPHFINGRRCGSSDSSPQRKNAATGRPMSSGSSSSILPWPMPPKGHITSEMGDAESVEQDKQLGGEDEQMGEGREVKQSDFCFIRLTDSTDSAADISIALSEAGTMHFFADVHVYADQKLVARISNRLEEAQQPYAGARRCFAFVMLFVHAAILVVTTVVLLGRVPVALRELKPRL